MSGGGGEGQSGLVAMPTLRYTNSYNSDTRPSLDGYSSSNAVTPRGHHGDGNNSSFTGTPRATPGRKFLGGGGKRNGRLSDADELQSNSYYEESVPRHSWAASPVARISNASPAAFFSLPSPMLATEFNDVEAGRCYPDAIEDPQADIESGKPTVISEKPPPPLLLKFVDVRYSVITNGGGRRCGRDTVMEKDILHGVTGIVAPGQMLAMMGPSGSGKTTLLNILGGRYPASNRISGTITYNDLPFDKRLTSRIGFVTQDDILYPHLTVRETLTYAALLRLPKHYSRKEKIQRAEVVIEQLGLERCGDTVIGGAFLRGVSGGERKRVCIGHEILIDPSMLCLDEPTSGLDSTTALRLIKLLQNIAQGGRTVVTTIHQPSTRLFNMFEQLILLSEGSLIYFGKASDATNYFEGIGFKPLITMNPAEYFIDLCSGTTSDMLLPSPLQERCSISAKDTSVNKPQDIQIRPAPKDVKEYLAEACKSRMASKELAKFVGAMPSSIEEETSAGYGHMKREWNTSWWQQFIILTVRGFKERRHEYLSTMRIVQVIASAIVGGCLWWQSKLRNTQDIEDQVGLLFFMSMYWGYLPLVTAIFTFPLERAVLSKERASSMYRLSAYFMSRTCGDLPLDMILPVFFVIIIYFMAHLYYSVSAFFLTLLTIFLIVITSQSIGLLIGAALMDVKKATTLASILVVAFVLSGGFVVQHIPMFIGWVRYISFQYYGFKLLLEVQYGGGRSCPPRSTSHCPLDASSALHGITLRGGGEDVMAMLLMTIVFRLGAYVALRRSNISPV